VSEEREPGRAGRVRPIAPRQNAADGVFIDLDTESERKLFGNPLIAETGIPALHLKNRVDQLG